MFCLSRNYTFNNDYFRLIESNYVTSILYKKNYYRSVDSLIHFTNFSQSQEINKIKVFKQFLSMLSDLLLKVELNFINAEIFRSYNKKSVKTRNPCWYLYINILEILHYDKTPSANRLLYFIWKEPMLVQKKAFELSTLLYWGEDLSMCLFFVSITFNLII